MAAGATLILGPGGCGKSRRLDSLVAADGLLVVDNAHHLDSASLATLAAYAGLGGAMVVAARPDPRPQMAAVRDEAADHGTVEVVRPLEEEELAPAVRATGIPEPDPAIVTLLAEATGSGAATNVRDLDDGWAASLEGDAVGSDVNVELDVDEPSADPRAEPPSRRDDLGTAIATQSLL